MSFYSKKNAPMKGRFLYLLLGLIYLRTQPPPELHQKRPPGPFDQPACEGVTTAALNDNTTSKLNIAFFIFFSIHLFNVWIWNLFKKKAPLKKGASLYGYYFISLVDTSTAISPIPITVKISPVNA